MGGAPPRAEDVPTTKKSAAPGLSRGAMETPLIKEAWTDRVTRSFPGADRLCAHQGHTAPTPFSLLLLPFLSSASSHIPPGADSKCPEKRLEAPI